MTAPQHRPHRSASRPRMLIAGLALAAVAAASTGTLAQSPALSPAAATAPAATFETSKITLLTHDSFALSDTVMQSFEQQTGIHVDVLKAGDAGGVVNQAVLSKDHPLADVMYGVDNTFLSRALDAGILMPYHAVGVDSVPAAFRLDQQERVTPIDFGDVCVNLDTRAFGAGGLRVPATIDDLTRPEYKGKLVVENPATSSPGLAFLLATVARFGDTGDHTWRDYWKALRANDVAVSAGWEDAYYGQFSGGESGTGDRPMVVSYASSPVAEVYFAKSPPPAPPTQVLLDGCFRQVEFAGVMSGTTAPNAARAWVDFMLSKPVQEDIPLQMFVLPVLPSAALPDVFTRFSQVPSRSLTMDPATISANRDRWINEWTDIVLR
jgi:thiamine transport system substrate-binding protein